MKINASTKSLVERLCDFKIYATSVLSFIGSGRAPDKATLTAENHALQCTTAGPYNAITSTLLEVGSICGLGPDVIGISSISLAARYRIATCSTHSPQRSGKSQCGTRAQLHSSFCSLSRLGALFPSMAFNTANAFDIFVRLDRNDTLDDVPQTKKKDRHWSSSGQTRPLLILFPVVPQEF